MFDYKDFATYMRGTSVRLAYGNLREDDFEREVEELVAELPRERAIVMLRRICGESPSAMQRRKDSHPAQRYESLRPANRAQLKHSDPGTFEKLRNDWIERGSPMRQ